jgi:hypothetical protein
VKRPRLITKKMRKASRYYNAVVMKARDPLTKHERLSRGLSPFKKAKKSKTYDRRSS